MDNIVACAQSRLPESWRPFADGTRSPSWRDEQLRTTTAKRQNSRHSEHTRVLRRPCSLEVIAVSAAAAAEPRTKAATRTPSACNYDRHLARRTPLIVSHLSGRIFSRYSTSTRTRTHVRTHLSHFKTVLRTFFFIFSCSSWPLGHISLMASRFVPPPHLESSRQH